MVNSRQMIRDLIKKYIGDKYSYEIEWNIDKFAPANVILMRSTINENDTKNIFKFNKEFIDLIPNDEARLITLEEIAHVLAIRNSNDVTYGQHLHPNYELTFIGLFKKENISYEQVNILHQRTVEKWQLFKGGKK